MLPLNSSQPFLLSALLLLTVSARAETWSYDLLYHAATRMLDIKAHFSGIEELETDRESLPFLRNLPMQGRAGKFTLPCKSGCDIRYAFAFAEACKHPMDEALQCYDQVSLSNPRLWLLRPPAYQGDPDVTLHFTTDGDANYGTGLFPKPGGPDTYMTRAGHLRDMPWTLFGKFQQKYFDIPGARIHSAIIPAAYQATPDQVQVWVQRALAALVAFYGKFPVPHALIVVMPRSEGAGPPGTSYGDGGAVSLIPLRLDWEEKDLERDWVMTHEMVHFAFPMVPQRQHWMEEGLATYVEPIARLRTGELQAEEVFHDMMLGMPKGLPQAGDHGLDNTPTWGRTYWGGALFALLADKEIRARSQGKLGLDDALRALVDDGGTMAVAWDFPKCLEAADKGTGMHVLRGLYAKMRDQPYPVDLDGMWKDLGVELHEGGKVTFDDKAPLAFVRKGMSARVKPGR